MNDIMEENVSEKEYSLENGKIMVLNWQIMAEYGSGQFTIDQMFN